MDNTSFLEALHFGHPVAMIVVFIPALIIAVRHAMRHSRNAVLERFVDRRLLPWLLAGENQGAARHYPVAVTIFWLSAALAAGGPYWGRPASATASPADVAVVVDVSPSMRVADGWPDRLETARLLLRKLSGGLRNERVSLVVFSAAAYALMPLSLDRQMFSELVNQLDTSLVPVRGSNLARGLELGRMQIEHSSRTNKMVLLITDGETHTPGAMEQAKLLREAGVRLIVAGIGTMTGGPVPDAGGHFLTIDNQPVISRLDEPGLARLAKIANGSYTHVEPGDIDAIANSIIAPVPSGKMLNPSANEDHIALYPWLICVCLFTLLWNGSRRLALLSISGIVLLPALLAPHSAQAAPWTAWQAHRALVDGRLERARQLYETMDSYNGWLGRGSVAYRKGEWQHALEAFTKAFQIAATSQEKARASYNIGNALARMAKWDAASDAFRKALRLEPNFNQANFNLRLVDRQVQFEQNPGSGGQAPRASDRLTSTPPSRAASAGETAESAQLSGTPQTPEREQRPGDPSSAGDQESVNKLIRAWRSSDERSTDNTSLAFALEQLQALHEQSRTLIEARIRQQTGGRSKTPVEKPW